MVQAIIEVATITNIADDNWTNEWGVVGWVDPITSKRKTSNGPKSTSKARLDQQCYFI